MIENIRTWLSEFARGAVDAFGAPSVKADLTPGPDGKSSFAVLRTGYEVHPLPGREEHQRVHAFDDLGGFAEWLQKHAESVPTEILFDSAGKVTAGLTPQDRYGDLVTCQLKVHPRLQRWLGLQGKALDQRQFHRHIVSSLDDFPPAKSTDGIALGSSGGPLAAAVQKIAVKRDGKLEVQVDDLGFVTFSGGDQKTAIMGKLPPRFTIRVPWFIGADPSASYDLEVHIAVDPDAVTFTLEIPNAEVVKHAALLDAATYLRDQLGQDWLVGLGALKVAPIPTIAAIGA